MMKFLSGRTIKHKLMLIIMLTCTVALFLACTAILFFEVYGTKQILKRNTQVMADVIGENTKTALTFKNDSKNDAKEVMAALRAEQYVVSACVYNDQGDVFATYFREGEAEKTPTKAQNESFQFTKDNLNLFHKIMFDGEMIGTVYIQSDLRIIKER